jgi:hypothetical protein
MGVERFLVILSLVDYLLWAFDKEDHFVVREKAWRMTSNESNPLRPGSRGWTTHCSLPGTLSLMVQVGMPIEFLTR